MQFLEIHLLRACSVGSPEKTLIGININNVICYITLHYDITLSLETKDNKKIIQGK